MREKEKGGGEGGINGFLWNWVERGE